MSPSGSAPRPCHTYTPGSSHKGNIYPPHFTYVKYILHDIICGTPCHFVSCPYTLSQTEHHAADSFCQYNCTHPHAIPVTACRQIPDFPVCKLKSTHRLWFQSYCSVRAPPIYPPLLAKTNFHIFSTYAQTWEEPPYLDFSL